ncbi:MAG TPA: hypothetical protein VEJ46_01755 [Candidatus Acidoferrum sp.]|nr:hypothetical protein [Candidatus Acidoferrum sp.]
MRAAIRTAVLLTAAAGIASGQTPTRQKTDVDRLGMTCAQILKMSSTEWIAYFGERTQANASNASSSISRAAVAYGKCYDARTDALAASLTRSGKGPSKAARAEFSDLEMALKNFETKALADTQPPADPQKRAFAVLYEEQFRYQFYQSYERKIAKLDAAESKPAPSPQLPATAKDATPATSNKSSPADSTNTDEMTKAKNRFGELLGALPDDKLHELHAAFGQVLGLHELDNETRLAVYRYAIFLLEPSPSENSYPPPF